MGKFYDFLDENGKENRVVFEILDAGGRYRRYGISAKIFHKGILQEEAEAPMRFLTRKEAEEAVEMLCRFQVTPCTLCDIV